MYKGSRPPVRTLPNYELAAEPAAEAPPEVAPEPKKSRGFGFFGRRRREAENNEPTEFTDQNLPAPRVVLNEAIQVNKETLASLQRSEKLAAEAEAVGHETTAAVLRAREQIQAVDDTMDSLEPMSKRAANDIRVFARGLARDKCFIILFILVVLLAIAVVLASQLYPKALKALLTPNTTAINSGIKKL